MRSCYNIALLSTIPWEWTADYLRQTALELARKNHLVFCYVWHDMRSIKELWLAADRPVLWEKKHKHIWVYTAIHWLPFKRFPLVVKINEKINIVIFRWLRWTRSIRERAYRQLVWVFDPGFMPDVAGFSGELLVYDSLDFFAGALVGQARKAFEVREKQLIQRADLVFANSHFLHDRAEAFRKDVGLVPQGFDENVFAGKVKTRTSLWKDKRKPVIGYVGGVNMRLNFDLLIRLAKRNPDWEMVYWGPVQNWESSEELRSDVEKLRKLSNVVMGEGPRSDLGEVIRQFDVGMIPYIDTDFNRYCHPMKIFEYFYFGVPTVASEIYELSFPEYVPFVRIARSLSEWEESLRYYIDTPLSDRQKERQKHMAIGQSWEIKISRVLGKIDEKIEKKDK